jgi:hypothetical protein
MRRDRVGVLRPVAEPEVQQLRLADDDADADGTVA